MQTHHHAASPRRGHRLAGLAGLLAGRFASKLAAPDTRTTDEPRPRLAARALPRMLPLLLMPLLCPAPAAALLAADPPAAPGPGPNTPAPDRYVITLDAGVDVAPASGRIVLFFITESGPRWARRRPIDGPFFSAPQPIASIPVTDFGPGSTATIQSGSDVVTYPQSPNHLHGPVRVQAILVTDQTERSRREGPGNVVSDIMNVTLDRGASETINIVLNQRIDGPRQPREVEGVEWVRVRSELLSTHYGRDVYHRAGVALPPSHGAAALEDTRWPAVYIIPGYGGRDTMAASYGSMLRTRGVDEITPIAVHIVLDPESPLGHHGFTDNDNHGPRGTALITELIPYLEERFNLEARPEARLLTGHSSGGWTSLWLQLQWPDFFGGCWSSAPDPVDFTAFQMSNIYQDESMFLAADGSEQPSYRELISAEGDTAVRMTVRQECLMEHAIHPLGGSGEQWDAWEAMFSPKDPATGYPKRMFDRATGRINRDIAETSWANFDITRLVARNWERLKPTILTKVRLFCGELDNYYLERAVRKLRDLVDAKKEAAKNAGTPLTHTPGYIELLPEDTHGTITNTMAQRVGEEMKKHFEQAGLTRPQWE